MANGDFKCVEHKGHEARIESLEHSDHDQWVKFDKLDEKFDSIFTRINVILGGIAVSCILLAINLLVGK